MILRTRIANAETRKYDFNSLEYLDQ